MIGLGEHWEFVAAAYIGAAVIVIGLSAWTAIASRAARARVAELEAQRERRRAR